jgi:prevent-host-death family protein
MKTVSVLKINFPGLVERVGKSDRPVRITHGKHSAVLLPYDQWRGIQETIHLLSVPGMRASIVRGLKTPVKKCSRKSLF